MKLILAIGAGSFIGGVARYLIAVSMQQKIVSSFPWPTFVVNIAGCLLIGFVYGFYEKGNISVESRLFLATGVLGGFTTFSAFSYESLLLFKGGSYFTAMLYISLSIIVGLLATFIGLIIVKAF